MDGLGAVQRRASQHRDTAATDGSQLPGWDGAKDLERDHQTSVRELGEGQLQAACSCGWRSIVFGADKQLGTMDALQHAQDAADLHRWDASLP